MLSRGLTSLLNSVKNKAIAAAGPAAAAAAPAAAAASGAAGTDSASLQNNDLQKDTAPRLVVPSGFL